MGRAATIYTLFKADLTRYVAHRPSILHWIMTPGAGFGEIGMGTFRAIRPWYQWIAGWGYDINGPEPDLRPEAVLPRIQEMIGDPVSRSRSRTSPPGRSTRPGPHATPKAGSSAAATPSTGTRPPAGSARTPLSRMRSTSPGNSPTPSKAGPDPACWSPTPRNVPRSAPRSSPAPTSPGSTTARSMPRSAPRPRPTRSPRVWPGSATPAPAASRPAKPSSPPLSTRTPSSTLRAPSSTSATNPPP